MLQVSRLTVRRLITAIVFILLVCTAACSNPSDSTPTTSAVPTLSIVQDDSSVTEPENTVQHPTGTPFPTETQADAVPADISFDLNGDQSSSYRERLYVDANITSISIVGGDGDPLHIDGKIADSSGYCYSQMHQINQVEYSMDGSSLAILLDYDESSKTARLVYTDGQTAVDVASDVDSFHLSDDGSAILYLSGRYEHGVGGYLYYYDCTTGESRLVSEGAGRLYTLSPSGDCVSYTTFYEADNPDALTCLISVGENEPAVLDTDSYCAALSDDAKTVYYVKKTNDGEVFSVRYNKTVKVLSLPSSSAEFYSQEHSFYFNADHTQAIFVSGGSTFFSMAGSNPSKIIDGMPEQFAGIDHFSDIPDYLYKSVTDSGRSTIWTSVSGTKNLCSVPFFSFSYTLFYFDENMAVTEFSLPSNTNSFSLAGNSLLCSDSYSGINGTIYVDYLDPDTKVISDYADPTLTQDRTLYYQSSSETNEVSYKTSDLYAVFNFFQDNSTEVLIADGVYAFYLLERDGTDILFFLTFPADSATQTDNESNRFPFLDLYKVEEMSGAQPELVAHKVCMVETGDFGVLYRQYVSELSDDYSPGGSSWMADVGVYYSKDGISFEYVMKRPYVNQFGG